MSYLLTEIALEMMGFKYYDIDGTYGPTNFKHVGPAASDVADGVSGSSEPSLQQILELDMDEAAAAAAATATNNETASATWSVNNVDAAVPTSNANAEEAAAAPPAPLPTPTSAGALVRLLDYEYSRIYEHVQRNQTLYIQSHTDQLKCMEQRGACTPQEFLKPYVESERRNLQREVQTMHEFRRNVERSLVKMNPENFEKYRYTFRRNKRALEKMGQQKQQPPKHSEQSQE